MNNSKTRYRIMPFLILCFEVILRFIELALWNESAAGFFCCLLFFKILKSEWNINIRNKWICCVDIVFEYFYHFYYFYFTFSTHLLNYLILTVFTSSFIRYFLFFVKRQKFYVIKAFQQKEKNRYWILLNLSKSMKNW